MRDRVLNSDFFRILLISDLHIKPHQKLRDELDNEAEVELSNESFPDGINIFFDTLDKMFRDVPEVDYPKAIIVSGDLVEEGGLAKHDEKSEFEVAKKFLGRLADRFRLVKERIIVVPGNHDVDWSSKNLKPDRESRFDNYIEAVENFKSPSFKKGKSIPERVLLKNIKMGCYDVEILLLVSPTYSGTANEENKKHLNKIIGVLNLEDKEVEEQIRQKIEQQKDCLDIAAIGREQRNFIRQQSPDAKDTIRIAVMHHHLLPDTQLDIVNFEAVIDSGKVLEDLVEYDFDLVLTGHKHNRKFMNISIGDTNKNLDVFSSPSLFLQGENCLPGFSILEINTPSSPYYAQIRSYRTKDGQEANNSPLQLERKNRVSPDLKKACAQIPSTIQKNHLLPITNYLRKSFEWSGDDTFEELFNNAINTIQDDLKKLSNRTLVFRHPYLDSSWSKLVRLAHNPTGNNTIKLVSEGIDFFRAAMNNQGSEAARYSKPLKDFSGTKERAFIFDYLGFQSIQDLRDINNIINSMINEDGFDKIYVVYKDKLTYKVKRDFAIIGGFAVGRIDGSSRAGNRSLEESFATEAIEQAEKHWKFICERAEWDSSQENLPFSKWLKDTLNIDIDKDYNEAN